MVWQDTRTFDYVSELSGNGGQDRFRASTGLPLATYFRGLKIRWILKHVPGVRELAEAGDVPFGNVDMFLIWKLTGRRTGGIYVTDVTNASHTQLMSPESLDWDEEILSTFGIPREMLPRICSNSEVYGCAQIGALRGVPIAGDLGDHSARCGSGMRG